jgi:hypothetical protein
MSNIKRPNTKASPRLGACPADLPGGLDVLVADLSIHQAL